MTEKIVEKEFRIVLESESEYRGLEMPSPLETRIWNWIKKGTEHILDLSAAGLAEVAETLKCNFEKHLGGEWEVAEMSMTVSVTPSVNILIKKRG